MKEDITKLDPNLFHEKMKQIEIRLQESEEKFIRLFQNAPNTIIIVDRNGIITDCNAPTESFIGHSRDTIIGKPIIGNYIHKNFRKKLEQEFEILKKTGHIITESIMIHKNRSFVYAMHATNALYNDEGEFTGAIIFSTDISAWKKAERQLKASEKKFKTLFESAPDAYFIIDIKGTVIDGNSAAEKLFGYKKEELIDKNILKTGLVPLSQFPMVTSRLVAYSVGKIQKAMDITLIKKDKSLVEVEIFSSFINLDNRRLILNIARDITKINQAKRLLISSEKKYRDLFEKSKDAILIISNGQFVDCNKAAVIMLGYRNKKELLDMHPSELSPEMQADGLKSFEKANKMMDIALKKGSHRFEWDHKKANGDVFPVEVLLTAIDSDNDHKVLYTVWRDISERKNAELELNEYHSQLEKLITERTQELEKSNTILIEKNRKLEHFNDLFVDREFRIKELKERVMELEKSRQS